MEIVFTGLFCHFIEVYAAGINTNRRSSLHSGRLNTQRNQLFRQACRSRFRNTTAPDLSPPDMHQTVQECSVGKYNRSGTKLNLHAGLYATNATVLDDQFVYAVLPHPQIRRIFQNMPPGFNKAGTITLRSRAPHSRTFTPIQHPELNGCPIGYNPHKATHRIDFTNDLSFGDSSDSRITTHLRNLVHVHRD